MRPAAVVAATMTTELITAQTRNSRRAKVMDAPFWVFSLFRIVCMALAPFAWKYIDVAYDIIILHYERGNVNGGNVRL